jgi:aminoacylase
MTQHEIIKLLQDYIKINTACPAPQYSSAIKLFSDHAQTDGFLIQEIILPSGNPVLVITYQGTTDLPALALNHHMDVVPAENISAWVEHPFAGVIREKCIIGRGTQDMKGVGVAHYAALKELKKNGYVPKRTIHLLLVPDEEQGGFKGTKEFLSHPKFDELAIGFVLDEGMPSGNDQELLIKVEERTPLQIKVSSRGLMGHASTLSNSNCVHALLDFLSAITSFHANQQKQLITQEAGKLMSAHITSLKTNTVALNVIPSLAEATIDIRVPSHYPMEHAICFIQACARRHATIAWEILATSEERFSFISQNSAFYKTLSEVIHEQGYLPKPHAFEATTDVRFYTAKNIEGIGLTPFTVAPNLHGTNESIYVKDLLLAKTIFYKFLIKFCVFTDYIKGTL